MALPQEVLQDVFQVIEGGTNLGDPAKIIQFPLDNGQGTVNAVQKTYQGTNGTGFNYWVVAFTQLVGGVMTAVSAGAAILTMSIPSACAAVIPALGGLQGALLYNLTPDFFNAVAERLMAAGQTINGKVITYLTDHGVRTFSKETIEIIKDELCARGIFEHGFGDTETESGDLLHPTEPLYAQTHLENWYTRLGQVYKYEIITSIPVVFMPSPDPTELATINVYAFAKAEDCPLTFSMKKINFNGQETISTHTINNPATHYGESYAAIGIHFSTVPWDNITDRIWNGSAWQEDIGGDEIGYIILYGHEYFPYKDQLQNPEDVIYPNGDKPFDEQYPNWYPEEFPDVGGEQLPDGYPVEYPDNLPDEDPYQEESQDPDTESDPEEWADSVVDYITDPEYNPDYEFEDDPVAPPDPDPEPEDPDPLPDTGDEQIEDDPIDPDPDPVIPDPIPVPPLPDTVDSNKLFTVYNPSEAQLNSLGGYLWDDDLIEVLKKIWQNPLDGIISLIQVYATPSTSGSHNIILGYLDSGVSAPVVSSQFVTVDCGSVTLKEQNNNCTDYIPYTQVQIYLPFIGITELDTNEIMGGTINVKYKIDVYTGTCLAEVKITRQKDMSNGPILYTYSGNCSQQLPLTSGDAKGVLGALIGAAGAGLSIASGGEFGVMAGARMITSNIARGMLHVGHSGNLSANAGIMGQKKPYLIINRERPYTANSYNKFYGFPANKTVYLGNCTGFVRVKAIHLRTKATENEKNEIVELLKEGVIM